MLIEPKSTTAPRNPSIPKLIGLSAFGVVLGIVVHLTARRQLADLED